MAPVLAEVAQSEIDRLRIIIIRHQKLSLGSGANHYHLDNQAPRSHPDFWPIRGLYYDNWPITGQCEPPLFLRSRNFLELDKNRRQQRPRRSLYQGFAPNTTDRKTKISPSYRKQQENIQIFTLFWHSWYLGIIICVFSQYWLKECV